MKKLALTIAITAISSQSSAVTYNLAYIGIDSPYTSYFNEPYYLEVENYGITPLITLSLTEPTSSFSIYLDQSGAGGYSYTADWTYYSAAGFLVAQNVSCTSLDDANTCESGILLGAGSPEFISVTALDSATQSPLTGPTSQAFDLYWTANNNADGAPFGWQATFTPVPVPAAAWLFGSALLGLSGLKRKA